MSQNNIEKGFINMINRNQATDILMALAIDAENGKTISVASVQFQMADALADMGGFRILCGLCLLFIHRP